LARGLLGALLWIVASVVGLLGVVCCVTIILLPVGLLLLRVAGRSYRRAVALMLPRAVSHPVDSVKPSRRTRKKSGKKMRAARGRAKKLAADAGAATGARKKRRRLAFF
jgi:hypothetical protein